VGGAGWGLDDGLIEFVVTRFYQALKIGRRDPGLSGDG
jgi:hypothetical protein